MTVSTEQYHSNSLQVMPFISLLTDNEVEILNKSCNLVSYDKGEVIFRQNTLTSHIMYLCKGLVKIYKVTDAKKSLIIKIATPVTFIGLISVFGNEIHQYSASAIEPSEIMHLESHVFRRILQQNGNFSMQLLQFTSQYGLFIFERLMSQYQKQLPGRIADVILYFYDIYHKPIFEFPLTRRELAELAGTTKESFIRTLTEFKNDRIIHLKGKRVEIVSFEILKTLSRIG